MDWYSYTINWRGQAQGVIRPMSKWQARELGAELVPDFDPEARTAEVLAAVVGSQSGRKPVVVSFPPEGKLERAYPLEAEVPGGRL